MSASACWCAPALTSRASLLLTWIAPAAFFAARFALPKFKSQFGRPFWPSTAPVRLRAGPPLWSAPRVASCSLGSGGGSPTGASVSCTRRFAASGPVSPPGCEHVPSGVNPKAQARPHHPAFHARPLRTESLSVARRAVRSDGIVKVRCMDCELRDQFQECLRAQVPLPPGFAVPPELPRTLGPPPDAARECTGCPRTATDSKAPRLLRPAQSMPCLLKTLLKDQDETLLGHAHAVRGEALGLDGFGPRPAGFGISCFSLGKGSSCFIST